MEHAHGHRNPYKNDSSPDKLLESLEIKLTPEQREYLQENSTDKRTLLRNKFNLKFGTTYSKLQLTRAIEVIHAPEFKIGFKRDPEKVRNLFYKPRQKCWEARITVKKKRHILYTGSKEGAIQAVAEFKKKHGIR